MGVQLVWLKRDLRLRDHRPLWEAAQRGPIVCLYIYEPSLMAQPEADAARLAFVNAGLAELDRELRPLGGHITYRVGEVVEVLEALHREVGIATLWSHEETGEMVTYTRDKAVKSWARARKVRWVEIAQAGVMRPLRDRNGWSERWDARMNEPVTPVPPGMVAAPGVVPEGRRTPRELGLMPVVRPAAQRGGEEAAWQTLESFLHRRGVNYRQDMSSPLEGWTGCSRLSPYLAFGNISMRHCWQETLGRVAELRHLEQMGMQVDRRWYASLSSFQGRLHWHCHFMQKLEDEPRLEFENMARAFDGLRPEELDHGAQERLVRWQAGMTGYPMVDACMRALEQSGWLNFRMRAMVMSFASYHLWLPWRPTGLFLARQFLDFEPGIHWPQVQMQSGTTGINTVRIYSPTKQVLDQDPEGLFIRRHVPELARVPKAFLAQPHTMPPDVQRASGCHIGRDYPEPIVDEKAARLHASQAVWAVRRQSETREQARAVLEKHGSRKRPQTRSQSRAKSPGAKNAAPKGSGRRAGAGRNTPEPHDQLSLLVPAEDP